VEDPPFNNNLIKNNTHSFVTPLSIQDRLAGADPQKRLKILQIEVEVTAKGLNFAECVVNVYQRSRLENRDALIDLLGSL
jgi:hypothetical protein